MTESNGKSRTYAFEPQGRAKLLQPIETVSSREVRTFLRTILDDVHIQRRLTVRGQGYWPTGLVHKAAYLARGNQHVWGTERDAVFAAAMVHRLPDLLHESALVLTGGSMLGAGDIHRHVDVRLQVALAQLKKEDPGNAQLILLALGKVAVTDCGPAIDDPDVESVSMQAGRLQTIVELAWLQATAMERAAPLLRRPVPVGAGECVDKALLSPHGRRG